MVHLILKLTIIPIIKLWVKEVSGLENLPRKGPYIIAASHCSYLDHLIIGAYFVPHLNKKIHWLAKKEHFDNFLKKAWHNYSGAIPIDRQKGGKKALKSAIKALKHGEIIAIHPEGTRSLTGKLQRGKTGVARLALIAKIPVIPIGFIGTFEILPKGKYVPRLKRAVMNIGKPIELKEYYSRKISKKLLREATDKIMKEIATLSNQKYKY